MNTDHRLHLNKDMFDRNLPGTRLRTDTAGYGFTSPITPSHKRETTCFKIVGANRGGKGIGNIKASQAPPLAHCRSEGRAVLPQDVTTGRADHSPFFLCFVFC